MDSVTALHEELKFAHWEPSLKAISGVWSSIQTLQKQAAKSAAGLKKYRQYLERCIHNLTVNDVAVTDDEVEAFCKTWGDLWCRRSKELMEQQVARVPQYVEPWCERWLPRVYDDYRIALLAVTEKPTKRAFDRLMETTRTMFDEFEKAV